MSQLLTRNRSKTIVMFLAAISLCLAFLVIVVLGDRLGWFQSTGSSGLSYTYKAGVFAKEDTAIYDNQTGDTIQLGMTRDEAEQRVGLPTGDGMVSGMFVYADGLEIFYRAERAAGIRVINSDRYVTMRNIGTSSEDGAILQAYGNPYAHEGIDPANPMIRDYYFSAESFEMVTNIDDRNRKETSMLSVSFVMQEDRGMILICDLQFARYFS